MASQVTVTATLQDPSGTALTDAAFVRFRLRNFQGFIPQIQGTGVICETQIDALPNGSGQISQLLWPNNVITPGTTFYTVEYWSNGRFTSAGNYLIDANTDLDTAAQLNAPPVPEGFLLVLQHNSTLNSSQNTLNLENTDGSVTITDEGGGTLNLTANTGQGHPDTVDAGLSTSQALSFSPNANLFVTSVGGASGITLTLPAAGGNGGRRVIIKKTDSGVGSVTIQTATEGERIDGVPSYTLLNENQYVVVESDGSSWFVVGNN